MRVGDRAVLVGFDQSCLEVGWMLRQLRSGM